MHVRISQISLARVVWLVEMFRMNPEGFALGPVHRGLIERYGFLNHPVPGPDSFNSTKGAIYKGGEFRFNERSLAVDLTVYNDGLVVDSATSTAVSEAFLNDLAGWVTDSFGFRNPKELIKKPIYDSQLYFTSDIQLAQATDKMSKFNNVLRDFTGNPTQEPWALLFQPDGAPVAFSFERKASTPFSERQYYSKAALPTDKHIELLEIFHEIFR